MTERHLRIFLEVCKAKNFTKAASLLYLAQPAVSLAIKELENYYHIKLFNRSSKAFSITESGLILMHYASEIINVYDDIENIMTNQINSTLNIGSSITIAEHFLPQYIKAFKQAYPAISVRATIETPDIIIQKTLAKELDFSLIDGDTYHPYLTSTPYYTDHFVAIAAKDHPLVLKEAVTFAEFLSYDLLLREQGSGERELIDSLLKKSGIEKKPSWESKSTRAIINGVIENLGVTILPLEIIRDRLYVEKIQYIHITDVTLSRKFYILSHPASKLTDIMKNFIELSVALYK